METEQKKTDKEEQQRNKNIATEKKALAVAKKVERKQRKTK